MGQRTVRLLWVTALLFGGCLTAPSPSPDECETEQVRLEELDQELADWMMMTEAVSLIQFLYVDETAHRDLLFQAMDGMLRSLDPHSSFLPPESYDQLKEKTSGQFFGIGATVAKNQNGVEILAPLAGSPAEKAGLKSGDTLLNVDGQPLRDLALPDAIGKIRGTNKSSLLFQVRRKNGKQEKVRISPGPIQEQSVKVAPSGDGELSVVSISRFTQTTPEELVAALKSANEKRRGLVIDLRNNPGGVLSAAVDAASLFLPSGKLIVSVQSRNQKEKPARHLSKRWCPNRDTKIPLVLLVNRRTASAAEIFAGALQSHKRAVVLGEPTLGKASVQSVIPLSSLKGAAIRLTTGYYLTPNGKLIQGKGILPDRGVEQGELLRVANDLLVAGRDRGKREVGKE